MVAEILWTPSEERLARANLTAFRRQVTGRHGVDVGSYADLHRWSVEHKADFWSLLWDLGEVVAERKGEAVLVDGASMPGARWFPEARLSYAENLLRRRDGAPALVFRGEDGAGRTLSFGELYALTARMAAALAAEGVGPGDRVAGYLPNLPEAIAALLACNSLGAVWSSCSPDFGVRGLIDRFGQIEPVLLFTADGYRYAGKAHPSLPKVADALEGLPSVRRVVVVPGTGEPASPDGLRGAVTLDEWLAPHPAGEIAFRQLPFDHPLYILYSSGTTGKPKCIVHGQGGTLLQHLKEHRLHSDVHPGDRLFYFTTLGWMMWNWLVTGLASGATLLLYDGSPAHPGPEALFAFAEQTGMTHFGTSAKYIDAIKKAGYEPGARHDLSALRAMLSTGSPLVPESFDWVYAHVKRDLCLSSISGGTDIVSCFVLGDPTGPVRRGEIQARGLGMDVQVFDDAGHPVVGQKGELVCASPFPSMPVAFWNDPDGARYRAAYFERFPGVWCHGDWAELTGSGGVIIYGRSDAVLNPGGVRIGTAEIYRQVEQMPEVAEALAVGQNWDGDVRVVLFVRLAPGATLDDDLATRIRARIRENCTPRHVPARVLSVTDIPRTKSGKITELAVREVIHGRPVKNVEALANPAALEEFRDRKELES